MKISVNIPNLGALKVTSNYPKATGVFEKFKKKQIADSKNALKGKGHSNTGRLAASIKGAVKKYAFRSSGRFTGGTTLPSLEFQYLQYGDYQDEGVKGSKINRAPKSQYKYTGNFKATNINSIRKWLGTKGLPTSLTFIISRSIYEKGLKPTNWWSSPFKKNYKRYMDKYTSALGNDIAVNVANQLTKKLKQNGL